MTAPFQPREIIALKAHMEELKRTQDISDNIVFNEICS